MVGPPLDSCASGQNTGHVGHGHECVPAADCQTGEPFPEAVTEIVKQGQIRALLESWVH
jgi:hypothetical protein